MEFQKIELLLSIIAIIFAILSSFYTVWRIWRDRPRLNFYAGKVVFHNEPDGKIFNFIQIKACNLGFRPVIITKFIAIGKRSIYPMGIHDNPAQVYNKEDQIFPCILEPGKTLTFHPMSVAVFEKNINSNDPYLYFSLQDGFERFYSVDFKDISNCIKSYGGKKRVNALRKIINFIKKKYFFIKMKKKFDL